MAKRGQIQPRGPYGSAARYEAAWGWAGTGAVPRRPSGSPEVRGEPGQLEDGVRGDLHPEHAFPKGWQGPTGPGFPRGIPPGAGFPALPGVRRPLLVCSLLLNAACEGW